MRDPIAFVRASTRLQAPPLVPEIRLHLADESLAIWQKSEEELGEINVPPPYWAFAWAGGQALARYLLDNPSLCSGARVLDLGSGSGISAIAAALAGGSKVLAADIDAYALAAVSLNAIANGARIETTQDDLLEKVVEGFDLVLIGDLFYERLLSEQVLRYCGAAKSVGAEVLIGDPQRSYFPRDRFECIGRFEVPVTRELEDTEIKRTAVWRA